MDYIDKMIELLGKKYTHHEVAENLYLNYHSVVDTDEVYMIRKKISQKYQCNINDVKLIGSAHTGYTSKNGVLIRRDNPPDYDFAIISAEAFVRFFHRVDVKKISNPNKQLYVRGIMSGKIHPFHADKVFLKEIETINREIAKELNVVRHITVCFYMSEKSFIDGLVKYNSALYTAELKKLQGFRTEIQTVSDIALKEIEKLEA